MPKVITIEDWCKIDTVPIIDVRSPKEYDHGHILNALSLPLFSDEERAIIGTEYKQQGKESAMKIALDLVSPRLSLLVDNAKKMAIDKSIRIHCWRGGMRSSSVAWLLETMGLEKVYLLKGGYKAYRNAIISLFNAEYPLIIIGGKTGSAKTDILKILASKNEPTINLEEIAHHKGSAFGWIGEKIQPSQEQFENVLGEKLSMLKEQNHIWIEDESETIGKIRVPHNLFAKMRIAKVYFLDIPAAIRIPYLVKTYADFGDEKLESSILKIQKRLGGMNTKKALEALKNKDYEQVAAIALYYYDKSYEAGVSKRLTNTVIRLQSNTIDAQENAELILSHYHKSK